MFWAECAFNVKFRQHGPLLSCWKRYFRPLMLKKTVAGYVTFFPSQSGLWRKRVTNCNGLYFISSQSRHLSLGPRLKQTQRSAAEREPWPLVGMRLSPAYRLQPEILNFKTIPRTKPNYGLTKADLSATIFRPLYFSQTQNTIGKNRQVSSESHNRVINCFVEHLHMCMYKYTWSKGKICSLLLWVIIKMAESHCAADALSPQNRYMTLGPDDTLHQSYAQHYG